MLTGPNEYWTPIWPVKYLKSYTRFLFPTRHSFPLQLVIARNKLEKRQRVKIVNNCFIISNILLSLDTFASKTAAIEDETADASIGNVTGSNAVNVFLGIGIAWTMAAVYWEAQGMIFKVPVGR